MQRFMQIVALIALAASASAIEVTTTPGQLASQIDDTSVTQLTVTGEMDARDFLYIANELTQLTSLDLSGVTIVAYSDARNPLTASVYDYAAGTLPQSMLMGMKLESIVLPSTLVGIGQAALAGCDRLTAIELPPTVTTIGDYAFSGTSLQQVTIPATVQTVGRGAFAHCFALESASVSASVIGDYAFLGDDRLQSVQLGEQVRRIGAEAFHGTAIQSLDASHATQLDSLGNWAMASTPLTTVSLPTGMTQMGDGAFFGTTHLNAASMPRALQHVPNYAFAGGSQIVADTVLHEGLTHIGDYAFYNWSDTRHFFIPGTVQHLGTRAMAGMTGMEQIDVAAAIVPTLGDEVWAGVDQPTVKLGTPDNTTAELYAAAEQWQDFYILHDYLLGDVNGDGQVDVTDINLTVIKMLGKDANPFIFVAADTDGNGTIDVSDVNEIVNIVLTKVGASTVRHIQRHGQGTTLTTDDRLDLEPVSVKVGETQTLDIYLHDSRQYSAMQFDITLPEGIEIVGGSATSTSRTSRHTATMRTSGTTSRVMTYSMQGSDFVSADDAIVRVRVRMTDEVAPGASIELNNIVLCHYNKSYHAPGTTVPVSNTTGVDNLTVDQSRAYAVDHTLVIEATEPTTVQVVSLTGMTRTLHVPAGRSQWSDLDSGVYVVCLQGKSYKVSLR